MEAFIFSRKCITKMCITIFKIYKYAAIVPVLTHRSAIKILRSGRLYNKYPILARSNTVEICLIKKYTSLHHHVLSVLYPTYE